MALLDNRGTTWSITINNPTVTDEEYINLARQRGWKIDGQKEKGEAGTLHYQLLVKTPQVRFSAMKKAFPRAHIELARNPTALANYVRKEESRVGQLPTSQDMYPSLSKLWELIYNDIDTYNSDEGTDYRFKFNGRIYEVGILSIPIVRTQQGDKSLLIIFDKAVGRLISQGYHIESMAVNPQVRSAWCRYCVELMTRVMSDGIRRRKEADDALDEELNKSHDKVNHGHHEEEFSSQDDKEVHAEIPEFQAGDGRHG